MEHPAERWGVDLPDGLHPPHKPSVRRRVLGIEGGDHWLDVNEAVRAGFIDEVIEKPTDQVAAVNEDTSPSASPSVVDEDGSEALLYDLVRAIGPIRVRDRARFAQNLNVLLLQQVSELPRPLCDGNWSCSPVPPGQSAPGESFSISDNP